MKKNINIDFKLISRRIFHWNVSSKIAWNSMIFKDLREYMPWDAIKNIHWKSSAKSWKTFVKIFEEDKDLKAYFFVDIWEKMHFWKAWKLKIDAIKELYEILSFSVLSLSWKVFFYSFTQKIKDFFNVWNKSSNIKKSLDYIHLTKEKTSLEALLSSKEFTKINSSAIFILTSQVDFWDNFVSSLKKIWYRNDLIFINVFHKFENDLEWNTSDILSDFESWVSFDYSDKKTIERYKKIRKEKIENVKNSVLKASWRYFLFEYEDEIYPAILKMLSK